jgi:hypothetical protein
LEPSRGEITPGRGQFTGDPVNWPPGIRRYEPSQITVSDGVYVVLNVSRFTSFLLPGS